MTQQEVSAEILTYYSIPGPLTDLSRYSQAIDGLTDDVNQLTQVVQGIILHVLWVDRYKIIPTPTQLCQALTPRMTDLIDIVSKNNHEAPFAPRPPGSRVIACCREFATLLCALLRTKGIPARSRCGFAAYLAKQGYYEDHWVCEFWNGKSWQMVDPQIDGFQLDSIKTYANNQQNIDPAYQAMLLSLNPMNLTEHHFITAGKAWQLCLNGKTNPECYGLDVDPKPYGLDSLHGLWFVRGNLIRDFLALNKIEIQPFVAGIEKIPQYWEGWRLITAKDNELTQEENALLDRIAELSIEPDTHYQELRTVYEQTPSLWPPKGLLVVHKK
ncbi:MAG: transglutaminase domain-containing protein [Nanoarchaeota archaeon]